MTFPVWVSIKVSQPLFKSTPKGNILLTTFQSLNPEPELNPHPSTLNLPETKQSIGSHAAIDCHLSDEILCAGWRLDKAPGSSASSAVCILLQMICKIRGSSRKHIRTQTLYQAGMETQNQRTTKRAMRGSKPVWARYSGDPTYVQDLQF